jgi:gas vesicle protein
MSTDPDQIRREIEATRSNLSSDVDALAYKVSPARIVDDRKQRARNALQNVRDKVMGTASDLGHSTKHGAHSVGDHASSAASAVSDKAHSAASTVGDKAHSAASTVSDAAHRAPHVIRQKSEGNPLAAGLIAFGVGWLASSLIPATRREQQVATQVKEKAGVVREKLGEVASELKEELREPAQHATESVKSTAQDAVHAVKDDTRSAAQDVKDQAQQSREQVRY